jgi:hypothetical protein
VPSRGGGLVRAGWRTAAAGRARASGAVVAVGHLALLTTLLAACEYDEGIPYQDLRERCVERINEYRATEGLPPYQRWKGGEECADEEARLDSLSGTAHGAFPMCGESAQNECPGWPSLDSTVEGCLDMMWAEGPGEPFSEHGHYLNMSSTTFTEVACGFHVTPSGSVWAVQNFR